MLLQGSVVDPPFAMRFGPRVLDDGLTFKSVRLCVGVVSLPVWEGLLMEMVSSEWGVNKSEKLWPRSTLLFGVLCSPLRETELETVTLVPLTVGTRSA